MKTSKLGVSLILGSGVACHPSGLARISDADVVVAGQSGGGVVSRPKPNQGAPLGPALPDDSRCVASSALLGRLGPTCDHETENSTVEIGVAGGDLEPGLPAPSREVRWYCDERMVVRVVFEPCDTNEDGLFDGVRPVEMGLATHAEREP